MPERTVVITSRVGLHARPAAAFVKAAARAPVPVSIRKAEGEAVSAASILSVLTLGAAHGDSVVLSAEGEGAATVLEELAQLLEHGEP